MHRYRVTYIYVLNENPGFMALGAKTMSNFYGSSVFGNWAIIRFFGAPHRLSSSLSGATIMAHKPKIDINLNPTKGNLGHFG